MTDAPHHILAPALEALFEHEPRERDEGGAPVVGATDPPSPTPSPPDPPPDEPPCAPDDSGGDGSDIDWVTLHTCADEPETDVGNARRIRHRFGDDMLWIKRLGWHVYDSRRWAEDFEEAALRPKAHETAELIELEKLVIQASAEENLFIEDGKDAQAALDMLPLPEAGDDGKPDANAMATYRDEKEKLNKRIYRAEDAKKAVRSRRATRIRFAKSTASTNKLNNMLTETKPYVAKPLDALDAEPLAINLEDCTLRIVWRDREGNDHPQRPSKLPGEKGLEGNWVITTAGHARSDFISKLAPVTYDPEAECPRFEAFMETVMPEDDLRSFIQRYLGYSLSALTVEQVLVFFYGGGRNGKSTLVDLIARILGDYSASLPFETLAGDDRRKGGDATPDLVRIPGARLVRAAEPEQSMEFREAMVKSLTAGEPILVRPLHGGFNEVYPKFKLIISGNHKPQIKGTDDGIWRRFLLVPWEVQIPKEQVDPVLPDKLWAERSGILNWLIAGLLSYLETGLDVPEKIRAATQEYREESDPIGAFIRDALEIGTDYESAPGDLVTAFEIHCRKAGVNTWKATTFSKQFAAYVKARPGLGIEKAKRSNTVYRGCQIKRAYTADGLADDSYDQHLRG